MPVSPRYRPSTQHLALGDTFYDRVPAAVFPKHILRFRNQEAAASIGLDTLTDAEWIDHFGKFEPLPGSLPEPLALRYHGHQFRSYNPALGDGRGFLFAQAMDLNDCRLLDMGTKGSGRTPWSRGGDGKLTLKGGMREILAANLLQALGVTTSRALSLIETGEALQRGDEPSPTRSAVLVRLSHSHIRIGSFQRLATLKDREGLEQLVLYSVRNYFPGLPDDTPQEAAVALFDAVCRNVARLGAEWMAAGFVHGVLNTDNITITGESFDYGPWRFLPRFDPRFTAAFFDHEGLYAYGRQPEALMWNLGRFGECLLELVSHDTLMDIIRTYPERYEAELDQAWLRRLGVQSQGAEADRALRQSLLQFMATSGVSFAGMPFDWFGGEASAHRALSGPRAAFYTGEAFAAFRALLGKYDKRTGLNLEAPVFAAEEPRDMLIQQVEALWAPIAEEDDWTAFYQCLDQIAELRAGYQLG